MNLPGTTAADTAARAASPRTAVIAVLVFFVGLSQGLVSSVHTTYSSTHKIFRRAPGYRRTSSAAQGAVGRRNIVTAVLSDHNTHLQDLEADGKYGKHNGVGKEDVNALGSIRKLLEEKATLLQTIAALEAKVAEFAVKNEEQLAAVSTPLKDEKLLAYQDDRWANLDESQIQALEAQGHHVEQSSSKLLDRPSDLDAPGCRTWEVESPIHFKYVVRETQNLLDPANDALIFGHLPTAEAVAEAKTRPQRRLVVIDDTVYKLHGDAIDHYFQNHASGVVYEPLVLNMVEEEKDMRMVEAVAEKMKAMMIDRREEPVIAIGGGVCLDVVGLTCTMFRRGIPYIRVPTTLLSYVDASVGAKSGVNFLGSKNRLGAYVPPKAAILDPTFITTEEPRNIASGMAEIMKMALVKDARLFDLLESNGQALLDSKFQVTETSTSSPEVAREVLQRSIGSMLEELAPNLWEHKLDRLVDFGHVFGQELELVTHQADMGPALTHGESVAVDMAFSTVLSRVRGHISDDEEQRILNAMVGCGLPIYHPAGTLQLWHHAMKERVKQSMGQKLVLPTGVGVSHIFNDISDEDINEAHYHWTLIARDLTANHVPFYERC